MTSRAWTRRLPLRVGLAIGAAWLGVAFAVGNLYPFSRFEMYGGATLRSASRIAVRSGNEVVEVERFEAYACPIPVDPDPRACLASWPFDHLPQEDRDRIARIDDGPPLDPEGALEVEIVRRIWRFEPGQDAPRVTDCVLASCRAGRAR